MKKSNKPAPLALPVLGWGRHTSPNEGSCLMEYVSVLAGERFSDHPRCTHPALTFLAQLVNDQVGDDVRQELAHLAPDLIGTHRRDRRIPAAVIARVSAAAMSVCPQSTRREQLHERACRRVAQTGGAGLWPSGKWRELVRNEFAAYRQGLIGTPRSERDRKLAALLSAAIADCHALHAPAPAAQAEQTRPARGTHDTPVG